MLFALVAGTAATLIGAGAAQGVEIRIGTVAALPGQRVAVPVSLFTGSDEVWGAGNDLEPAAGVNPLPTVPGRGRADCVLVQDLAMASPGFGLVPSGCAARSECTAIRILLVLFGEPLRDGRLYTCRFAVSADTEPTAYAIRCLMPDSSDFVGNALATECADGSVRVTVREGDCNGDGRVQIGELVQGVNAALGLISLDECPPMDSDFDETIRVNDVVRAVAAAFE